MDSGYVSKVVDTTASTFSEEDELQNLIRGSSCTRAGTASIGKRMVTYKRDWCGLLC